jgi:hypothetical protein
MLGRSGTELASLDEDDRVTTFVILAWLFADSPPF